MSAFFTNNCESCGGGIEFPANGVGEQIECPHCHRLITLQFPPLADSNPSEQLKAYLTASVFPKNRDELRLLSEFISPVEMGEASRLDYWGTIVNDPCHIVEGFLREGLIQDASSDLIQLLQCMKSSAELKALAKERGIPHSGTKQRLAERLVKADAAGMSRLFAGRTFLTCSTKGAVLADKFRESEKYERSQAEHECFEALAQMRFEEAALAHTRYRERLTPPVKAKDLTDEPKPKCDWITTAEGVLPPGTDLDVYMADRAKGATVDFLRLIFAKQLARHACFDDASMRAIRLAASMMALWGDDPPKWLLESHTFENFDLALEARMLLFGAHHVLDLQGIKQAGGTRVQILSAQDDDVCDACASDDGKIYPVDSCPVLPHENCTCEELGCRCCTTISAD